MKRHDRETLEKATAVLQSKPRGSWVLCQVSEPKKPSQPSGNGGISVINTSLQNVIGREFINLEEIKIDAMNCVVLRFELKSRSLKIRGNKQELLTRLKAVITDCVESLIREEVSLPKHDDTVMVDATATVAEETPKDFTVAEDCAYVMFKDKKIVTFYSNDFDGLEMTEQVMDPVVHNDLANKLGCLALLFSWTGVENMMRSRFWVPVMIVVYNMFMNAVDRFDQKRAACAILRKEMRVYQSTFTWILDAACINANALRTILQPGDEIDLPEFKRRIALDVVSVYVKKTGGNPWNKRPRTNELTALICSEEIVDSTTLNNNEGNIMSINCHHSLVDNINSKRQIFQARCILCCLYDKRKETKYGCTVCKQYYHVNCFAILHKEVGLISLGNVPAHLVENTKVKEFLTGKSK